jgi:hypothetical protein
VAGTPQAFARQIQEDLQRYRKLIADAHVQAE